MQRRIAGHIPVARQRRLTGKICIQPLHALPIPFRMKLQPHVPVIADKSLAGPALIARPGARIFRRQNSVFMPLQKIQTGSICKADFAPSRLHRRHTHHITAKHPCQNLRAQTYPQHGYRRFLQNAAQLSEFALQPVLSVIGGIRAAKHDKRFAAVHRIEVALPGENDIQLAAARPRPCFDSPWVLGRMLLPNTNSCHFCRGYWRSPASR